MKTVAWLSGGVSSAVAIKLAISEIDEIYYIHIDDQHEDTLRFVRDCEEWFGKKVDIKQHPYINVETALLKSAYINGTKGAPCTRILKRRVRQEWERTQTESLRYVWGMDFNEKHRFEKLKHTMPQFEHYCPLIDEYIDKQYAHMVLNASGIKRPAMYDLGYMNNNCIGCVKGGMGYWNKIRKDFPEVFQQRAKMERMIGHTCIKGIYLDELNPEAGRNDKPIVDDCGIMCELIGLEAGRS